MYWDIITGFINVQTKVKGIFIEVLIYILT